MNGKVLLVDDERSMCELLDTDLRLRGFDVAWFTRASEALQSIESVAPDVVLTDVRMPEISGLQLCQQLVTLKPDLPVIVMTAFGSMETAIAALRSGAYDFVTKPIETDLLAVSLQRAIERHRLQDQVRRLAETVDHATHFADILGDSPAMQRVYAQLAQLAPSDTTVLLTGESGTGKELVARCIHRRSRRSAAPFVAVNCAAIPEPLLESELFGHAKGAFTDARGDRKGLFLQAESGTLFLDEIGELPLTMQVKLLRALEQRSVRPVGSEQEIPFDVRLLSATNRDLEAAIHEGRFREDLYYRINVIQLELPPLRARGADLLLLAQSFLQTFAEKLQKPVHAIQPAAAERLLGYHWPGNVRELRNVIERAATLAQHETLGVDDLPEKIRNYRGGQLLISGNDPTELISLEEMERRYVAHVLAATGGNQTQAARILGVDRKTLYRKLKDAAPPERP